MIMDTVESENGQSFKKILYHIGLGFRRDTK